MLKSGSSPQSSDDDGDISIKEGKLILKSDLDKIKITMGNMTSSSDPLSMAEQCRDTLQSYNNRIEKAQDKLLLLKLEREHELSRLL